MKLEFDSTEKPETLRAVAAFALMLAGDIPVPSVDEESIEHHKNTAGIHSQHLPREMVTPPMGNVMPFPVAPSAPSTATVPTTALSAAPDAATVPPTVNSMAPVAMGAVANPFPTAPSAPVNVTFQPPFPPFPSTSPASVVAIPTTAPPVSAAAAASNVASASPMGTVEYDSAGLPWDARIHNKGRTKKKDGTWKLQKGLDPIVAQTVVAELAAKRVSVPSAGTSPQTNGMPAQSAPVPPNQPAVLHSMQPQVSGPAQGGTVGYPQSMGQSPLMPLPPTGGPLTPEQEARAAFGNRHVGMMPELGAPYAPTQVPLPPAQPYQYPMAGAPAGALPVPPFPGSSGPAMVPPPPVAAPVPPTPQPGTVGGGSAPVVTSPYKQLIDKLTAATQNKTLNPALVAPTVQRFGVPNMGMLGDPAYAGLLPAITQEFDRLIAGGAPSGP